MKIAIVHLSDLHISDKKAIRMENVTALVNTLQIFYPFSGVILSFSGDIAAHGYATEYTLASKFIGAICKSVIERYSISENNIKVLVSPGNHDMNRNVSNQIKRAQVQDWYYKKQIEEHTMFEIERMKDFYSFAHKQKCFFAYDPTPFTRKVLPFTGDDNSKIYIEANLFNTALFSGDDDDGVHYMPHDVFNQFAKESKAHFSISIMHHSPDWFWPEQKVQLQKLIYSRSQLVLYGHEHYETSQEIALTNKMPSVIQCGGAWWENSFENSSFYGGVIDSITGMYCQFEFVWNEEKAYYQQSNKFEQILAKKSMGKGLLTPSPEYIQAMVSDEKHIVCSDITKYFVFPQLDSDTPLDDYTGDTEIKSMVALQEYIERYPQIMILGENGAGKTTLAKMLFLQLISKYTVLLCGTNEVSGKIQKNIIKDTFCSIYSNDDFPYFEQQSPNTKVIIIDDSHLIKPEHLSKLLNGLGNVFGHIILLSEKNLTFEIRERISEELEMENGIRQLSIERFYADKRRQLIRSIIDVYDSEKTHNVDQLESQIENSIGLQDLAYKTDPDFIVKFASYFCAHEKDIPYDNKNVFSKVFEASIEVAITPYLRKETIGQIKTALGELAYYIHFNHAYPVSESVIDSVVQTYAEKYDEPLSSRRFLEVVVAARLVVRCDDSLLYRFKNRDQLAYFVAEAVMRRFNENDEDAEAKLREIVELSCFSINPTILKFIAYTTGNIRIVKLLLEQAVGYVQDWPAYDIDNQQFTYLSNAPEFTQKKISSDAKEKEISAKANREKKILAEADKVETVDIYDYNVEDLEQLNNQLIRAFLQMNTISSCLVTFSHIMPAETKRELISALYSMPNQMFYKWASEIDQTVDEIIRDFQNPENLPESCQKEDIVKIRAALQKVSINLLLNLYYAVSLNGVATSTIENLSRDRHIVNINHELERLMFWECADNWDDFIVRAEKLYNQTKSNMVKTMIGAMVYHLLVWSPTLPADRRDHLIDTFKFASKRKAILAQNALH